MDASVSVRTAETAEMDEQQEHRVMNPALVLSHACDTHRRDAVGGVWSVLIVCCDRPLRRQGVTGKMCETTFCKQEVTGSIPGGSTI